MLSLFPLAEKPIDLLNAMVFAKTPFPLTRGYLKGTDSTKPKSEHTYRGKGKRTVKKVLKKKVGMKAAKNLKRKRDLGASSSQSCMRAGDERRYVCSICKKKQYKYRRNKLRHEKYECVTGPQFACECGKKYSQKKTLMSHIALKHPNWVKEDVKDIKPPNPENA